MTAKRAPIEPPLNEAYQTMAMRGDVLPDYDDPEVARNLGPIGNPVKTFKLYYDTDRYIEVDVDKIQNSPQVFDKLTNKLNEETKQEDINKIIETIRRLFGVSSNSVFEANKKLKKESKKSESSSEGSNDLDREIEKILKSSQTIPNLIGKSAAKNNKRVDIRNSKVRVKSTKTKRKRVMVVFKLEDLNINAIYEKIRIGTSYLSDKKFKFLVAIEKRNRLNSVNIKPSIITKLMYLVIPKYKMLITLKPFIFEFNLSKKYRCIIFIINKILKKNDGNGKNPINNSNESTNENTINNNAVEE